MTSHRLATFSVDGSTRYGAVVKGGIVDLSAHFSSDYPTLREVIAAGALPKLIEDAARREPDYPIEAITWLPPASALPDGRWAWAWAGPPPPPTGPALSGPEGTEPFILGGTVILEENPCTVRLSNSWIIMNPGGAPTPDKPGISVVDYQPDNTTSIFMPRPSTLNFA